MIEAFTISALVKAAYLAVTMLSIVSLYRVYKQPGQPGMQQRRLWTFSAIILVLLGFNNEFKALSGLTERLRDLAWSQGWYNDRWAYQLPLIVSLLILGGLVMLYLSRQRRSLPLRSHWVVLDLFLLLGLTFTRAVSYHMTDKILYWEVGGTRLHYLLQLTYLVLLGAAALVTIFEKQRPITDTLNSGVNL